ncbi:3-oxoacyl-ACP synthase [Pelomyxa schiedti]|nr:3-oxoacyl-ACP synthase [Pelomyxa schiedti]
MDIHRVSVEFGDRFVTNEEVIGEILKVNPGAPVEGINMLFSRSGAITRALRSDTSVTALQYIAKAFSRLEEFKSSIKLVIFTSVTKGVIEPSQASLVCQSLGIRDAQAFDVTEACNGTLRAMSLAYSLFLSDQLRTEDYALIVAAEFWDGAQSPTAANRMVADDEELTRLFAGLSMGCATSLILLRKSTNKSWNFTFHSDCSIAGAATVCLPNFMEYLPEYHPPSYTPTSTDPRFKSTLYGEKTPHGTPPTSSSTTSKPNVNDPYTLHGWVMNCDHRALGFIGNSATAKILQTNPKLVHFITECDHLLVHSHSKVQWDKLLAPLGVVDKPLHIYPKYGNISTATFGAAMWLLFGATPQPGKRIMFLGPASGLSAVLMHFCTGDAI